MKLTKLLIASSLISCITKCKWCYAKINVGYGKRNDSNSTRFLNNNLQLIKDGSKLVKEGNDLFSDKKVISSYLPENKKHMANVAANASTRISLALNVLEVNLDDKAYVNAANAYSDMLNACSSCHSIVRNW